jgi:hypothetical protein
MADRKEVKELLERASVEITNALQRADDMSEDELEEVSGGLASPAIRAFFDQNGSCAGLSPTADLATKAFFDQNGSCGAADLPTNLGAKIKR